MWLFLHSGSRGVGNKIAMRHIAIAAKRAERERLDLPDRDLAWLDEGTPEFDRYIAELRWAQHFALLNREEMMDRVADCLARHMRVEETPRARADQLPPQLHPAGAALRRRPVGVPQGRHPGEEGAGRAHPRIDGDGELRGERPGQPGLARVVPARGRAGLLADQGPEDVHPRPAGGGDGRHRVAAQRRLPRRDPRRPTRPIDVVMEDAKDLVEVRHTLRQLVNVKGD